MTSPEHTLVGIHLAFAGRLHRICGWKGVFLAGLASNVPDWDGLPMLIDMQRFEAGHRVWGHNVLAIVTGSLVLAFTQVAFDWIGVIGRSTAKWFPRLHPDKAAGVGSAGLQSTLIFLAVAVVAQFVHLPCDMVVSGGNGLSDWPIKPWWPFSDTAYVFPLIPWGDPGPTIILMAGIITVAKWPSRLSVSSLVTLVVLGFYLGLRGWLAGRI